MSSETKSSVGSVVGLWRYPVKSMQGQEGNSLDFSLRGVLGDRAYALIDAETGKVVSAKNPKRWPSLFDFRAAYSAAARSDAEIPSVRITLPDGTAIESDEGDLEEMLSKALGAKVTLEMVPPEKANLEEYWPDIEDLDHRDKVTDESMPAETFFDFAPVHLLTTGTIDHLRQEYPQGRFEVRRFRPNVVVEPAEGTTGAVEMDWVGHTVALGEEVQLKITGPCPRCVMTTLPQGDLPRDLGILRTAAKKTEAKVGVYADVVRGGRVRRGGQRSGWSIEEPRIAAFPGGGTVEVMTTDRLLHAALTLPTKERAKLAHDLLRSLDGPADADADAAWAAEIERRAHELDDGSVEAADWESARERIAQRLRERRR